MLSINAKLIILGRAERLTLSRCCYRDQEGLQSERRASNSESFLSLVDRIDKANFDGEKKEKDEVENDWRLKSKRLPIGVVSRAGLSDLTAY